MKTETRSTILALIRQRGELRPNDLVSALRISSVAIHQHLLKLIQAGQIEKVGKPPLVYYRLKTDHAAPAPHRTLDQNALKTIEARYLYISPQGKILKGWDGFYTWAKQTKQDKHLEKLADEYLKVLGEADSFKDRSGFINAKPRLDSIFKPSHLDEVYYQDFYSLPKFGKTYLGQCVLYGKQAQDETIIREIASVINPGLSRLISERKIGAIAWVPHSLPRKKPFLKILKASLSLPALPEIPISKVYAGALPIPQKSLSKLEERLENASQTMVIKKIETPYDHVLLIDDAVGSGATLDILAAKLKSQLQVKKVVGYAIVGSYKEFEVIKEI